MKRLRKNTSRPHDGDRPAGSVERATLNELRFRAANEEIGAAH
jgi:hypothetical protein